jgi:hypothetical protein
MQRIGDKTVCYRKGCEHSANDHGQEIAGAWPCGKCGCPEWTQDVKSRPVREGMTIASAKYRSTYQMAICANCDQPIRQDKSTRKWKHLNKKVEC